MNLSNIGSYLHVAPIVVMGALALGITFERFLTLFSVYPIKGMNRFFEKIRDCVLTNRIPEAISLCDQYRDRPVAKVVKEGLLQAHQPETLIEDSLQIAAQEAIQKIQKRLSYLATIANVVTLLGLLGTVAGLVQSFEAIGSASAAQRSALLAAGISNAMSATMMGLGVAVPCLVFYSFLSTKANSLVHDVQQATARTLRIIKTKYYSNDSQGSQMQYMNSAPTTITSAPRAPKSGTGRAA